MDVDSRGKAEVRLCWDGTQTSMLVTRQDLRRLFSSTWQSSLDRLWRDTAITKLWVNDTIMVAFCQLLRHELAQVPMDFFDPGAISTPYNDGYNRRTKVSALCSLTDDCNLTCSFFYLQGRDVSKVGLVIFPFHSPGHWALYVHNTRLKTLRYYDSGLRTPPPDTMPDKGEVRKFYADSV
jgi:hypothetical protein